jgi:hypothetical protein
MDALKRSLAEGDKKPAAKKSAKTTKKTAKAKPKKAARKRKAG